MLKTDRGYYVLLGTLPFVVGAWVYFTFLSGPVPGDPVARVMFSAGVVALIIAVVLVLASLEQDIRTETLSLTAIVAIMLVAIAASVERTGEELTGLGTFIAAVGLSIGGLKYLGDRADTRRREERAERLRRHERIMSEWTAFVSNAQLIRAIRILEYEEPELQKLGEKIPLDEYAGWKNGVDQILEALLRLAFAVKSDELDAGPVREAMGWYFRVAARNEHLRQYCQRQGYDLVIEFGQSS